MSVKPFQIHVDQSVLDDLQQRLATTRWPDEEAGTGWDQGSNLGYMRGFADYWQREYDWRKQEAALNNFHWFKTEIDGWELRFIHERGKGPGPEGSPTPIVLIHGWPDSVLRYTKLIPMLTDPTKFGGDPNDSFDVIVIDLLDHSGSAKRPVRPQLFKGWAERIWRLMTGPLGYTRFVAGGGDGGSPLSQMLAVLHPESILGIHLTDIGFAATMVQHSDLSPVEQEFLGKLHGVGYAEGAYAMVQGTKPQTLAYGLNDSSVGLAAWIVEKFRTWSDCDGDVESVFSKDELLTNIMLYWITGFDPRGYREEWVSGSLEGDQRIDVPVGLAQPPKDLNPVTPHEFAERNLKDIRRWTILPRGGHFVAMEDPAPIAEDIRAFVRDLKRGK